jgi:hypothetical protein
MAQHYFSTLDLQSGYHRIQLGPMGSSKGHSKGQTHRHHYEFLVKPFGLFNASSTFESTMSALF